MFVGNLVAPLYSKVLDCQAMSLCCKKLDWRKRWYSKKTRLFIMMTLTVGFFFVEIVVGEIVHSNALKADAFHMLSDVIALVVAYVSVFFAPKKWSRNTFGFARAEVLGALTNSVFLMALCFEIFTECIQRFLKPEDLDKNNIDLLLWVGIVGLIINVIGLFLFHDHGHSHGGHGHSHSHGHSHALDAPAKDAKGIGAHDHEAPTNDGHGHGHAHDSPASNSSMNIKGVFLHILADALGSVIVIASATVYEVTKDKPEEEVPYRKYVDPGLSLILVLLIVCSTWPLFRDSALILLQTMPDNIEVDSMKGDLMETLPEIEHIHEFHIWQLVEAKVVASIHVKLSKKITTAEHMKIAEKIKDYFHMNGIHATTVQFEYSGASQRTNKKGCALPCPSSTDIRCSDGSIPMVPQAPHVEKRNVNYPALKLDAEKGSDFQDVKLSSNANTSSV